MFHAPTLVHATPAVLHCTGGAGTAEQWKYKSVPLTSESSVASTRGAQSHQKRYADLQAKFLRIVFGNRSTSCHHLGTLSYGTQAFWKGEKTERYKSGAITCCGRGRETRWSMAQLQEGRHDNQGRRVNFTLHPTLGGPPVAFWSFVPTTLVHPPAASHSFYTNGETWPLSGRTKPNPAAFTSTTRLETTTIERLCKLTDNGVSSNTTTEG